MSDKKSNNPRMMKHRCDQCERSILPICCLISMLTAVFVTLIFSTAFTSLLVTGDSSDYKGAFSESISIKNADKDNFGFTKLNSAAIIDMIYLSKSKGIVIVTGDDATENDNLANLVMNQSQGATIYHYSVVSDGGDKADEFVRELLVGGDSDDAPTLLYISNGQIYDRIDDTHSESVVSTYIGKYK
jgi:hypothetical protein